MYKRFLLIFFLFTNFNIFSQEKIDFDFSPSALDEEALNEEAFIKNHYLGSKIARKIKLVDLAYKWIDPPTATRISAVVKIEKQPIYFALKKIISPKFYKNKTALVKVEIQADASKQIKVVTESMSDPLSLYKF